MADAKDTGRRTASAQGTNSCHDPRNQVGLAAVAACAWSVPCVRLRSKPDGPFSDSRGRSPGSATPLPCNLANGCSQRSRGQRPGKSHRSPPHSRLLGMTWPNASIWIKSVSVCGPKIPDSLKYSGGIPSQTPEFVGHDKAPTPLSSECRFQNSPGTRSTGNRFLPEYGQSSRMMERSR